MIYIGADHGGFELKEKVRAWLTEWGLTYQDMGPYTVEPEDDYPAYAFAVAQSVASADNETVPWKDRPKGILVCRSSSGMVIAANKVVGIRAVGIYDDKSARYSREHNDANVAALAGDWLDETKAREIVKLWLETEFTHGDRHERRIQQIKAYEQERQNG